jgi:uncharacterized protein (DUF362 family)
LRADDVTAGEDNTITIGTTIAACAKDEDVKAYHLIAPFGPPEKYPELPPEAVRSIAPDNKVYFLIRELLCKLGLDSGNFGTSAWNPLGEVVRPGQTVLLKPNLVTHKHIGGSAALYSTVTHGSVIRPIIDYVYKALRGRGRIVIADNPIESADFAALMRFTGIQEMAQELSARGYHGLEVIDLRPRVLCEAANGAPYYREQAGDPLGYATIDLGHDSMFGEYDGEPNLHYYTLADKTVDHIDPQYNGKSLTDEYHNGQRHRYVISKTVLSADVVISVAKLKSHCKAGVSLALKNMIGVAYEKNCMPHHRPGLPPLGDSFPICPPSGYVRAKKGYQKLKRYLYVHHIPGVQRLRDWLQRKNILIGQYVEHGNWRGNDTIWRTILDLNRIVLYADKDGTMQPSPQRAMMAIIDGIVSHQGEGPMAGDPVPTSVLFGGFNPVVADALAVKAMGLDYRVFKSVARASTMEKWKLIADGTDLSLPNVDASGVVFRLSKGWR